jgi:hypothetical protein
VTNPRPFLVRLLGGIGLALLLAVLLASPARSIAAAGSARHSNGHRKRCHKIHGKHKKKCKAKKKPKKHHARPPVTPTPTPTPVAPTPVPPTPIPVGPQEPELEPAPPLAQIPSSQIEQLPSGTSSTLVVLGSHTFNAGEFLSTPPNPEAPEGFLVKVVSSSINGGSTEVQTEPGSFFEAVPNGEINADLNEPGAAIPENAAARRLMSTAAADSTEEDEKTVSCIGGADLKISTSFARELDPRLELKWHKRLGIPTGIDTARVTLNARVSAEVSGSISGAGTCKLNPITLSTPKWEVPVDIGPIVVPVKVEAPIQLTASAAVSGKVSISAKAEMHGSIGAAYENGGIHGVHEFSTGSSLHHSAQAEAKLRVGIGPQISVKAGWSVPVLGTLGAELDSGITAGPELNFRTESKPPGSLCAFLDVNAAVGLDLPHEDPIKAGPHTFYDGDIACVGFGGKKGGGGGGEDEGAENERETGERELGERKGKDGEPEFEEEREREEEKRLEEEVERENEEPQEEQTPEEREEQEQREREQREREERQHEEGKNRAHGELHWQGTISYSSNFFDEEDGDPTYASGIEGELAASWSVSGDTKEGPDVELEGGAFELDYTSSWESSSREWGQCDADPTDGIYYPPFSWSTNSSGSGGSDSSSRPIEIDVDAPATFRALVATPGQSHTVGNWCAEPTEEFNEPVDPVWLEQDDYLFRIPWVCGTENDAHTEFTHEDGSLTIHVAGAPCADGIGTFDLDADVEATCREPGTPESTWPAPNARWECPVGT